MLTKRKRDHLKKEKERWEEQSDEDVWNEAYAEEIKEKEKECEKWKMSDQLYSALEISVNATT